MCRTPLTNFTNEEIIPGYDRSLTGVLTLITQIPTGVLTSSGSIKAYCIAKRMRWAAERRTARSEDIAYSLLGLFDVNMPLLYGEGGPKAFVRLQLKIMRKSADSSLFAWADPFPVSSSEFRLNPGEGEENMSEAEIMRSRGIEIFGSVWRGLLARSPSQFKQLRTLQVNDTQSSYEVDHEVVIQHDVDARQASFLMTPKGLRIDCFAYPLSQRFLNITWFR